MRRDGLRTRAAASIGVRNNQIIRDPSERETHWIADSAVAPLGPRKGRWVARSARKDTGSALKHKDSTTIRRLKRAIRDENFVVDHVYCHALRQVEPGCAAKDQS